MIQIIASIAACVLVVISVYLAFLKFADMSLDLILPSELPGKQSDYHWWPSIFCLGIAMGIIYALVSEVI